MEGNENNLSFCDNCRICLQIHQQMTPIQSLKELSNFKTLLTFFNIEVVTDIRYPNKICIACFNQLSSIINFKQKCESTFNYLKHILNNNDNSIKVEVSDGNDFDQDNTINETCQETKDEIVNNDIKTIKTDISDTPETPHTTSLSTINSHLKSEDGEDCVVESKEKLNLSRKNTKKPRFKCQYCDRVFAQACYHRRHEAVHIKRPFKCEHCPRLFENQEFLNRHLRKHAGLKPVVCTECNLSYTKRSGLLTHIRIVHNKKKFTCEQCGQIVQNLFIHNKHKHSEYKFECKYCNKKFPFNHKMLTHIKDFHENCEESFKVLCPLCGKKFRRVSELNAHSRARHSDERNYQCRHCDKKFKRTATRTQHEKSHSGVRPFKCSYCAKTFAEKLTLGTHIMIHTGEKPFSCDVCSKSFRQKATLRTHIKLVHGHALSKNRTVDRSA